MNKDKNVHRYAVRGDKKIEKERKRERKRVWERESERDVLPRINKSNLIIKVA